MTSTPKLTDAQAAREIARLTARLARKGRKDLADLVITAVQPRLAVAK